MNTVTITKKHCKDANFMDVYNCPLARAIREQLPEYPLDNVGGKYVRRKDNILDVFSVEDWNWTILDQIKEGKRESATVTF